MIKAWDADGHVYEWDETFSDEYLEPRFRDRRPRVVLPEGATSYYWQIPGREDLYKVGGSPAAMDGKPSMEHSALGRWRGTVAGSELHTPEDRFEVLDAENTWVQVNYPTMLLGYPLSYDHELNAALTRSYNSWLADVSSRAPDRLKWVTAIDPHDPTEAAREILRSKEMGSVGVMVLGFYEGRAISDPRFDPIWAAARDTGLPLAVHPGFPAAELRTVCKPMSDLQFKHSVLYGFNCITTSGILDRYPTVKVGFLETGCGWLDFAVYAANEKIELIAQRRDVGLPAEPFEGISTEARLPELRPEEYIARGQVFIGYEVEEEVLSYLVGRYGAGCFLYASDIPHGHRVIDAPRHVQERTDLSEETKRKVLVENTARFYDLEVPAQV